MRQNGACSPGGASLAHMVSKDRISIVLLSAPPQATS